MGYLQYKWNAICLAPGLFFYLLRMVWRYYWSNKYGIPKKPVPGAGKYKISIKYKPLASQDNEL